jgi:hypothetical protein
MEESNLYKNKKNQKIYQVISEVINCTNSNEGELMILYSEVTNKDKLFVRTKAEFLEKFELYIE